MINQEEIDVLMDIENEPIGITPETMGAVVKGEERKDERQRGRDEAWEAARKIARMDAGDLYARFNTHEIYKHYTASEAIEKLKAYEAKQAEIKVGDEICCETNNSKAVLTRIGTWGAWEGYTAEGQIYIEDGNKKYWTKTGKHYPQISEVLEQMKEE